MIKLNKPILLCYTALLQGLCALGTSNQFKTDFSGGIPPEMVLIDGDMLTPATAMASIGFAQGIPWIGYYIEEEMEYVACSTSWYKPVGTSDDWIILPPIKVEEGAKLCWRARCSDKKYFDGYAVYDSTEVTQDSDPEPRIFDTENPLFSIQEESNQWQSYEFPLEEYLGQEIYIAFVNNSTNKAKLYIDDIKAGTDRPIVLTLDVPALVKDSDHGQDITVKGTISSELALPSVLGDLTVTFKDQTIRIPCQDLIQGSVGFAFSNPVHIDRSEKAVIEITCTSENGYEAVLEQNLWSTFRPLMVEEFTGTWCSWCVRGIVYMELLKEHYGDMFIPLCVHEYDIMEVGEYFSTVDYLKEEAIPNAILNRRYECDPSMLYTFCEQALGEDITATFTTLEASWAGEGSPVEVTARVAFGGNNNGAYSIAYVLTEDNICVPQDGQYCQKNAYAGGAAGEMGGFENMPSVILSDDIAFRDVVRYVSEGGTHGVPGSLPGAVKAGEVYHHQYSITIPDYIFNPSELSLIAMIIDNRIGEVLNGRLLPLADLLTDVNAIEALTEDALEGEIEVYSISGINVGRFPSAQAFLNSKALPTQGCYILKDASAHCQKLFVR